MSDETTRTDGWGSTEAPGSAPQGTTPTEAERVAFCQDCGKPLTQTTIRTVGTGVFCEPCLTARVGATAPGYATIPPYSAIPPQPAAAGEPSPVLAAILGFIPGVGAMYNGQFAKGIVHLLIFAVLVSLSSNVNGLFGLFVAGWEFFMVFEAYHTAVARRDGLPLPNAFGFNDVGERMGFGKSWGSVHPVNPAVPGVPPTPGAANTAEPTPGTPSVPVNPVPVGTAPDWVGYVPPTAFASAATTQQTMAAQIQAQAARDAGYSYPSYAETYTGTPQSPYGTAVPPAPVAAPDVPVRKFPVGALWLIGLGALLLLATLLPDWNITERWWPPVLFAGLAAWTFTRRMRSGAKLVCIIRWPVILMVLAVMFALHAAYVPVTFGLTVSLLLIVFGGLLLLERTAGASPVYVPPVSSDPYRVTPSTADAQAEEARSRAAWDVADSGAPKSNPDGPKGDQ